MILCDKCFNKIETSRREIATSKTATIICPHCSSELTSKDTIPMVPFSEAISIISLRDTEMLKMIVNAFMEVR